VLTTGGAALNTLGYVLVMEAPGHEYAAATTAFWRTAVSWRSNTNPALATATFYLSIGLLTLLGMAITIRGLRLLSSLDKDDVRA
jgi:hypothetical protein